MTSMGALAFILYLMGGWTFFLMATGGKSMRLTLMQAVVLVIWPVVSFMSLIISAIGKKGVLKI